MSTTLPRLAITPGEPAGIGPDVTLQMAQHPIPAHVVAFADPMLLAQRAQQLAIPIHLHIEDHHAPELHEPGHLNVVPIALARPVQCGQLDPANAHYVLATLRQACQACVTKRFDALITAPVHKSIINEAGIAFSGHTEFLAEQTQTDQVVMMLTTAGLRVALVTTHIPLSQVSQMITHQRLQRVIQILYHSLKENFGLPHPHILVCGLNPHAGEGGHLGREEIETISPVLQQLRLQGLHLTGPVPADTAFTPAVLSGVDAVLAMYHDQGLPVLKHQGFGEAVNITLGLPIIRTSVDHGTALELAGTGQALSDSLYCAVYAALEMIARKKPPSLL
ncbi:MAG: 4-hydroxythreonine-4-phosphate dehydrogenase PdxA [Beggiatoa sp. IS2]|nr:MAG: 4-hydroxythreonine-4-phosphate dehydrogenase PdxA [Beggiatoa sp. IS2]